MAFYPLLKKYTEEIAPHLPVDWENDKESRSFLVFSIISLLDLELEEAILSVTDGKGDCGIDAICHTETKDKIQIHFFSTKFLLPKNAFEEKDINTAIVTVNKIINGRPLSSSRPELSEKIEEIMDIITSEEEKTPEYFIHFVSSSTEKSNLSKYLNIKNEPNISIDLFNGWELLSLLDKKDKRNEEKRTVKIVSQGNILEIKESNVSGIVANLGAKEIIKIYKNGGKELVFEENIRFFLGNKAINLDILDTALSPQKSKYFWFLNNGISIVCSNIISIPDTKGSHKLELENPRIINGGQTTKSLLKAENKETFRNIKVLVRMYKINNNEELVSMVVSGVNRQNPIEFKDLVANNPIQNVVKRYFSEQGYYLETKRGEYREKGIDISLLVKNDNIFQSYLSLYKEVPHIAKSGKTASFEKYFHEIFSTTNVTLSESFFRSFLVLQYVRDQEKKATFPKPSYLPHAQLALVNLMGRIEPLIKTDDNLPQEIFYNTYILAKNIVEKITKLHAKKMEGNYSHNNLFKSSVLIEYFDRLLSSAIVAKKIKNLNRENNAFLKKHKRSNIVALD